MKSHQTVHFYFMLLPAHMLFFKTESSVGENPPSSNGRLFHGVFCPSHLHPLTLCSSSCSSRICPGSTSSHSGIRTQCSRSISFKVRPVEPVTCLLCCVRVGYYYRYLRSERTNQSKYIPGGPLLCPALLTFWSPGPREARWADGGVLAVGG